MNQLESNLKMNEICRLCLKKKFGMISIFDDANLESFKIQLIIRDICLMKVVDEDFLPNSICSECRNKLYCLYDFVNLCKESDVKLHRARRKVSISIQTSDDCFEDEERHETENDPNDHIINIKREINDHQENEYLINYSLITEDRQMMVDDYEARKKHVQEWQNQMLLRNHQEVSENVKKENYHQQHTRNQEMMMEAPMQQGLWNVQAVIANEETSEQTQQCEEEMIEEDQLFGKHWPCEEMVVLQGNIYCRKSIYEATHTASQKASHIARRLITGVFKPEAIKRCTLTGQTPRSLGRQRLNDKVDCLHVGARNTIINYSMYVAEMKGWKTQSVPELKHALSQRLGELKREMKYAEYNMQQY